MSRLILTVSTRRLRPARERPARGGLTTRDAFSLLRRLRGINLVGGDVVEVLPDRDPGGVTAFLAAHILFEIIALDAANRTRA